MTYVMFEPLKEFENLNSKLHKIFGDIPNVGVEFGTSFNPRMDAYDSEDKLTVDAEMPGVKKEDIKISMLNGVLTLSGEKKNLRSDEKLKTGLKNERLFGSFSRSITLPEEADPENVQASFEDGVLHIEVFKKVQKQEKERVINIK